MLTKILIVDDNPLDLKLLESLLTKQDEYRIIRAENGEEVLEKTRTVADIGLILLDVQLPDINGIELCRLLKANPSTAQLPVVLISAVQKDDESITAGLDAGADGYLVKPVSGNALRAWVRATLRIRSLQQALEKRSSSKPGDEQEFLQTVSKLSHTVNNPLQTIMAAADLLRLDFAKEEDALTTLQDIQRCAEQIAGIAAKASQRARLLLLRAENE